VVLGGGCWRPCLPAAAGNWIQLPLAAHKGPIEGGGEAAGRPRQLPSLSTAPQKPLEPRSGKRERSRRSPGEGERNGRCGRRCGGSPGAGPSPARGWPWGPPSPSPGLQPHLCRCRPASIPVGNAPVVSRGAARPGSCPRPRSCPFPRGGHKGAIFAGLAELRPLPPATGQRDSPQPRCPPVPLSPAALGTPHSATSPAQGPGAVPASLWLRAAKPRGTPLPKKRDGAGERDQHRFSQLYPRTCVVAGRERG